MVIRTRIVKVGNSRGVRLPKVVLDQAGLGDEVEMHVEEGRVLIRPARRPRARWADQFRLMAERGDDRLLDDGGPLTTWDNTEWEW